MKSRAKVTYKDLYINFLIFYMLSLPLNAMRLGSFGSALKIIAVFPIIVALISGRGFVFPKPLSRQFIFIAFATLSICWTVSFDESLGRVISYIQLFVLLLSGSFFIYTKTEIKKIKKALVWSSRFTAIVILVFAEYYRGRLRLMGIINEDPNYICAYLAFGVIAALQIITEQPERKKKIFAIAELLIYTYIILATGSRGGLIAVLAGVIIYFMVYGDNPSKHLVKKIVLMTILATALITMIDYLPETLRMRFTINNVIADGGSGRTELWGNAWHLYSNAPLFRQIIGYGTASVIYCFQYFNYSEVNVVHNIFLETLVELGVIGLVVYLAAVCSFVKKALNNKDKFSFAVIFCMVIMSLSTSIYTFKPYFNIMMYIIMCEKMQQENIVELE